MFEGSAGWKFRKDIKNAWVMEVNLLLLMLKNLERHLASQGMKLKIISL
ncbi:hypothetical protein [Alkalihalophilus marmarensis]|nr:hypothetical protein [Alkalihalophilus marmarensis]MEC2071419.1 hypothetical protein [Alkalihalophilus marmarensis]